MLKDEQKKIIENIFDYQEKSEITDEDKAMIQQMFPTPDRFALLRKVLGVLTREEYGLFLPHPDTGDADENERQARIDADEKVRSALANLYFLTKKDLQNEMQAKLESENDSKEELTEKQKAEKHQTDINKRGVGENL